MLSITPRRAGRLCGAAPVRLILALLALFAFCAPTWAAEDKLILPDLSKAVFLGGINGHTLLLGGLVVSALGLVFGLLIFVKLRNMPVHSSMLEVSELIYETCKTFLATQ